MYGETSFKSADSDSDSNESELGEGGEYYAERFKLRLQLRKWESDFVSAEGRAADQRRRRGRRRRAGRHLDGRELLERVALRDVRQELDQPVSGHLAVLGPDAPPGSRVHNS